MSVREGRMSFSVHDWTEGKIRIEVSVYSSEIRREPPVMFQLKQIIRDNSGKMLKNLSDKFPKDRNVLKALSVFLTAYPYWEVKRHSNRLTRWDSQNGHVLVILASAENTWDLFLKNQNVAH